MTTAPQAGDGAGSEEAPAELTAVGAPAVPGSGRTRIARTGRTRISAAWFGVVATALVLVLLLIFILENMRSVKVSFFGASGTIPVGVALLFAAIGGVLLAGLVGSLRIWQLHHRLGNGKGEEAQHSDMG